MLTTKKENQPVTLENTHTPDIQFKEVERNINEREQEISRLIKQHSIPVEWFDVNFNPNTQDFKTDTVKEAYNNILNYQREISEYINTFCMSRDRLKSITQQIDASILEAQDAKMAIVKANQNLVLSYAKRFRHKVSSDEFLNLMHEGSVALMKAIDNFNYQGGYKFRTYATWWIRQGITRAAVKQDTAENDGNETQEEA